MSALDASFLHLETANTPMHLGWVGIFEGPPLAWEELVALVEANLALVPRYRRKLRFVPLGVSRPRWVDDRHFNLAYHLRHSGLPAPGGEQQLRNLVGRVIGSRHHPREIQRLVFVATDPERWCQDGLIGVVIDAAQRSQVACGRWFSVEVVAAE
jgi:Wax ester synthase/diacylglycerol acyltransferase catalytic domain